MLRLAKPTDSPRDVFLTCIQRVRNLTLKQRLTAVAPDVATAAADFELSATIVSLHTFTPNRTIKNVSSTEMAEVYDQRMVPQKAPGRPIYDKLLNSTGRCPLCAVR